MALINRRQIAAKIETTPGTAVSVAAADHIPRIRNPRWKPIPTLVDRDVISQSFSKYPPLVSGASQVEFTFEVELGGNPDNPPSVGNYYSAPHWGKLIRACSFQEGSCQPLLIGPITGGPFLKGENVLQGTSLAAGVALTTTYTGDGILWLRANGGSEVSGTFNATNTVTGLTSGATCVPLASLATGTANEVGYYIPQTDSNNTLTMTLNTGEKIITAAGCMGTVELRCNYGEAVIAAFTYRGIFQSYSDGAAYTGGTLVDDQSVPSTFISPDWYVTDGSTTWGSARAATGTITLSTQPNDGDQIVLDDGVNPAVTYEFDNNASVVDSTTLQQVVIGATAPDTITALIAKINTPAASAVMGITAYEAPADAAYLVNDTAGTAGNVTITETTSGARITVTGMAGGKAANVVSSVAFQMANDLQLRTNALSASGFDRARVVDRNPTGTFDPDEPVNTTFNFLSKLLAGTQLRSRLKVGSTAGRILYFYAPGLTLNDWADGDRAGVQTAGLTFNLSAPEQGNAFAADDELVIING